MQDGAERYAYFHYNGASATASDPRLSSISYAESQRSVEFEYTNKRLTKIKYKDGTFSTYTYGETGSSYDLTSVRDQIGYRLNYIYGNNKITIQESTNVGKIANNSTTNISEKYGNKLEIDFVGNKTFLKSKDGKCLVHIFDKSGTAICSYVDQGTALNGQKKQCRKRYTICIFRKRQFVYRCGESRRRKLCDQRRFRAEQLLLDGRIISIIAIT